jgi:hypothetical protein
MALPPKPSRRIIARLARLLALAPLLAAGSGAQALVGPSRAPSEAEAAQAIMVVMNKPQGGGFCTGVVLARDIVLTAAHCVHGARAVAVNAARAGAPRVIEARETVLHPGFQPDAEKKRVRTIDLALVRLAQPLPPDFALARLSGDGATKPGEPFTALGFGVTREGDGSGAGVLRAGALVTREPLSPVLLWARDPSGKGLGVCTGDSGGPVLRADGSVFALASFGAGDGKSRCGALTQASILAPHADWIARTLAGWR